MSEEGALSRHPAQRSRSCVTALCSGQVCEKTEGWHTTDGDIGSACAPNLPSCSEPDHCLKWREIEREREWLVIIEGNWPTTDLSPTVQRTPAYFKGLRQERLKAGLARLPVAADIARPQSQKWWKAPSPLLAVHHLPSALHECLPTSASDLCLHFSRSFPVFLWRRRCTAALPPCTINAWSNLAPKPGKSNQWPAFCLRTSLRRQMAQSVHVESLAATAAHQTTGSLENWSVYLWLTKQHGPLKGEHMGTLSLKATLSWSLRFCLHVLLVLGSGISELLWKIWAWWSYLHAARGC